MEPHITLVGACNFPKENAQRATWTLGKTLHRFVPNVKFSRLQRSLKKIHSEELDSEVATHHFGRSVQFFEEKCPASDLDSGSKYPQ